MPNIAFISTAHIHTAGFIKSFAGADDGRKVSAIWDDVPERGQRYAELANAPYLDDLDLVLADGSHDGFVVCAENTRHRALLERLIPLGKPVFCEKPLATNDDDLKSIVDLQKKIQTPLYCGYTIPFSASMQGVMNALANEQIGNLTTVRYRSSHNGAYARWFNSPDLAWFVNHELAGGGALMDKGTHAVHALRTLFGPVKQVWAAVENQSGIYPEVDDFGVIHLRFSNGIFGTAEAAWTHTGGPCGLEVIGSKGAIIEAREGYQIEAPKAAPVLIPKASEIPTLVDRLISIIDGSYPKDVATLDLAATIDTVAIMSAAYRSAQSGTWETLDANLGG